MYSASDKEDLHCCTCTMMSPLFRLLRKEELELINASRRRVIFKSGETIVKEGAPMSHVLSFTSGIAKLFIQGTGDRRLILQFVKPTQFLGGPGIYLDNVHYFSVAAVEESSVCFIDIGVFKKTIQENPNFAAAFMKELSREGVFNYDRFISLTYKNMHGRIADALLYLHYKIYNERHFRIEISRQDLADFTGMSKDSVIRTLKELVDDKLIEVSSKNITIQDLIRLKRLSVFS